MSRLVKQPATSAECDVDKRADGLVGDSCSQNMLISELSTLRCKLESKTKALTILSTDLLDTKLQRDEYKLMAEQIRDRYSALKRRFESAGAGGGLMYATPATHTTLPNTAIAQVLRDLTEQNKRLIYEVDELKMKLIDSEGDLKLLREQMHSLKLRAYDGDLFGRDLVGAASAMSEQRMDEVVLQLEAYRSRTELMERDLQSIIDEKEDLILSRDAYKAKVERLNKRLNEMVRLGDADNAAGKKIMDIDSIMTENRFLKERLQQMDEENKLATSALHKYKHIIDKANGKKNILNSIGFRRDSFKTEEPSVGGSGGGSASAPFDTSNVISSKQVQQFIASNNLNNLEVSQTSITQLRGLVVALFEAFSDKSSAFSLQKRNNKLLGKRIQELEDKIKELHKVSSAKEKVMMLMQRDEQDRDYYPEYDQHRHAGGRLYPASADRGVPRRELSDLEEYTVDETDSENRPYQTSDMTDEETESASSTTVVKFD